MTNTSIAIGLLGALACVVGCGASPAPAKELVVHDACNGNAVATRDPSGSYTMADGTSVPSSEVRKLETKPEMPQGMCGGEGTTPSMWARQVGNCLYYGHTESNENGTYSLFGYGCQNADGSWTLGEWVSVSESG